MVSLKYPPWAVFLGIAMTLVSVIFIPIVAVLRFFGVPKFTKKYPPTIRKKEHSSQALIVNGDAKREVNGNTECQQNGHSQQDSCEESIV